MKTKETFFSLRSTTQKVKLLTWSSLDLTTELYFPSWSNMQLGKKNPGQSYSSPINGIDGADSSLTLLLGSIIFADGTTVMTTRGGEGGGKNFLRKKIRWQGLWKWIKLLQRWPLSGKSRRGGGKNFVATSRDPPIGPNAEQLRWWVRGEQKN